MEIICGISYLLAAVFFGRVLALNRCRRFKELGDPILVLKRSRKRRRLFVASRWSLLLLVMSPVLVSGLRIGSDLRPMASGGVFWLVIFNLTLVGAALGRLGAALYFQYSQYCALYRQGIVFSGWGSICAVPWHDCEYSRRSSREHRLLLMARHVLMEVCVPAERRDEAEAVLCGLVQFRDTDGRVLNPEWKPPPTSTSDGPDAAAWDALRAPRFDLRTLLAFFVLLSAGAAWFGVVYRADAELAAQRKPLEPFGAVISSSGFGRQRVLFQNPRKVDDDAVPHVALLKGLQVVYLCNTRITEQGLAPLAAVTSLRQLNLAGTGITDRAIEILSQMKQLESLDLRGTKITPAGVERLRRALPQTKIEY